jgi:hypothetical protein
LKETYLTAHIRFESNQSAERVTMGVFTDRNKLVTMEKAASMIKNRDMVAVGGGLCMREPIALLDVLLSNHFPVFVDNWSASFPDDHSAPPAFAPPAADGLE